MFGKYEVNKRERNCCLLRHETSHEVTAITALVRWLLIHIQTHFYIQQSLVANMLNHLPLGSMKLKSEGKKRTLNGYDSIFAFLLRIILKSYV